MGGGGWGGAARTYLVARRAVAFVGAEAGLRVEGGEVELCGRRGWRRQRQVHDVLHCAAVAGAFVGLARVRGRHGGLVGRITRGGGLVAAGSIEWN